MIDTVNMNQNRIERRQLPNTPCNFPQDFSPLLQRIYALRGITTAEELDYATRNLHSYKLLNGMDRAVDLLFQAMKGDQHITIVGDFDTDGATSTALIVRALRSMGAVNVDYIIPNRFDDGYGLSIAVVDRAIAQNSDMIITVDNGISAITAVAYAKEAGLSVIITDHHLSPDDLPLADAIVNPNLSNCEFPSKSLAGVGVTFYFMLALRAKLRQEQWFIERNLPEYNLAMLLDLVALGTIADVVKLDHNNRILVHQGINRIRSNICVTGIRALLEIAKQNPRNVSSLDLAFSIAPRLNAAGRMDNMSLGVELLICDDYQLAIAMAEDLDTLNRDRKLIEQTMQKEALKTLAQIEQDQHHIPNGIVVYHPEWHQGIIGILSSRLKDHYYRPVISFAAAETGYLKGSGRSIPGIHLRDLLDAIDQKNPELIVSFGGHAMAVGLTISETNLDKFSLCFEEILTEQVTKNEVLFEPVIKTDGEIESHYFTYETAKQIKESGPWGEGFPAPLFDGDFIIHQQRLIGEKHLRLVLEPEAGGMIINGVIFNINRQEWPDFSVKRVKIVYHLEVDEYRGNQAVQLLIRYMWPIA
ncbi:single-stranded-DNA-specific exonuclease RecJ [Orbaceae bacterium ESL0721]|nr:single-stranded-DNA-specific exonuclease RecJ [Orbaceae bacterium ESL0721]